MIGSKEDHKSIATSEGQFFAEIGKIFDRFPVVDSFRLELGVESVYSDEGDSSEVEVLRIEDIRSPDGEIEESLKLDIREEFEDLLLRRFRTVRTVYLCAGGYVDEPGLIRSYDLKDSTVIEHSARARAFQARTRLEDASKVMAGKPAP